MEKKYNFYQRLMLYFPVFTVLISIIFTFIIIEITFKGYYKQEKATVKNEFYKNLKTTTKQRVSASLKLLNNLYLLDVKKEKQKLKDILNLLLTTQNRPINFEESIRIKISKHPVKLDKNYIFVYKKVANQYYYVFENTKSIKKEIKKDIAVLFDSFRWGKKGYLFVHDSKGVCYYHINKSFIGKNRWNLKRHGVYVIRKLIKAAVSHPKGVYVKYLAYNPLGKPTEKISFMAYDKNLDLTIGSGIYLQDLNRQLAQIEEKKQHLLSALFNKLLFFLTLLFIIISYGTYVLSKKIIEGFKKYDEEILVLKKEKEKKECFDELTDLLNRKCLKKEFENHKEENLVVIDIDINNFKNINEIYANKIGNNVIKIFSQKLKNILRSNDVIGKGKIDEFIIFAKYKRKEDIDKLAYRINLELTKTLNFEDIEIFPSVRIGIAFNKKDADNFDELVNKASMSAYNVKNETLKIAFYNKNIDEEIKKYMELKNSLARMIKDKKFNELEVYYQPQINKNEELAGMEALIRWNHPIKGIISPADFLPVAINEGMIKDIDLCTIETVIIQIKKWLQSGFNPGVISCNTTMPQLEDEEFVKKLEGLIKKYNLDTKYLGIEVTEESIMQNANKVEETLQKIKNFGIIISLDDFGTGYSNFTKLKTLPIDKLKIDKSFIDGVPNDKDDVALTEIVIQTAKILNMKLIAEGVENEVQKDFVFKKEVDYIQGYYYSKPLPAQKIEEKYFKNK